MRIRPAALVVAAALVALGTVAGAEIADRLDQPAAPLSCTKWWNGTPPKLSRAPGRAIVLHFHDPTRITSKAFEGRIKALAEKHADEPLDVIEILVDCDEVDGESYVARSGATWLIGHDGKGNTAASYMGSSVPRTYVIGPDGRVAWHAHVGALTEDILAPQIRRARWYDEKALPKKGKAAAKAARELRFGAAVTEAEKLRDAKNATPEEVALAEEILGEIPRYYAFQVERVQELIKSRDWTIALRRTEFMEQVYRGTAHEKDVAALKERIEKDPLAIAAFDGERDLERIIAELDMRKRKDVEDAIDLLERFATAYENYRVEERAREWIEMLRKRLAELKK